MTDPVQTPIQTVSVSCFSFGEIRDSYEHPLFRDSDKLKPSSSTETESGFQDMQVPLHQPLTPGQRASARECVTADKRWIETYVPSTYLANVRAPRRLDPLCRMVKTGTIGKPTSILVPQPKLPNEESEQLQNLFPSFWLGVLLVILAWVFRHSIYVWKLRRDWPYGERVHAELGRYISDFKKWRKNIEWDLYRCDPASRGRYGKGQVWLLSRDKVCFRVSESLIQTTAPNLLAGSYNCYVGGPNPTLLYVVRTDHSSTKIHAFLEYLQGLSFEQIRKSVKKPSAFGLRIGLHIMARQYANETTYEKREGMFAYREWIQGAGTTALHVFSIACRTKNVDVTLAKKAILSLGVLEVKSSAIGGIRNWVTWFLKDLCFDSLEAAGYTEKMHSRNAKAFGAAHEIMSEYIAKTKQTVPLTGSAQNNQERRQAALLLLADEFCNQLAVAGFPKGTITRAKKALEKPSRHAKPPIALTPAEAATRSQMVALQTNYSVLFLVLLHAVFKLNLPI